MFIAKVVGNVWATRKHRQLKNCKLLLVKPVSAGNREQFIGDTVLVLDGGVSAGPGDVVLVLDEGGSARKILANDRAPVRTVVCGVIDKIYQKNSE
ncbi:MAG: EutN/CcmL family microcompartment protein [Elusimicrobia bacterium]|nr:EutN/CcmL family microcompartment protein [Elusimicrobiota bacterium]